MFCSCCSAPLPLVEVVLMQCMVRSVINHSSGHFGTKTLLNRKVAAHLHICITPKAKRKQVRKEGTFQRRTREHCRSSGFPSLLSKSAKVDSVENIKNSCAVIMSCRSRNGSSFNRSSIGNCFHQDLVIVECRAYPREFFSTSPWCMISGLSKQTSGTVSPRNSLWKLATTDIRFMHTVQLGIEGCLGANKSISLWALVTYESNSSSNFCGRHCRV